MATNYHNEETIIDFLLALTDEDSCFIDGRLLRSHRLLRRSYTISTG